jgi:hypothetical protein
MMITMDVLSGFIHLEHSTKAKSSSLTDQYQIVSIALAKTLALVALPDRLDDPPHADRQSILNALSLEYYMDYLAEN